MDLRTRQRHRDETTIVIAQVLALVLLTLVAAVVAGFVIAPVVAPVVLVVGWAWAVVFLVRHRRP